MPKNFKIITYLFFLALTLLSTAANAGLSEVSVLAKKSLVYIVVKGVRDNGEKETIKATGFLISKEGFFITVAHNLYDRNGKQYYQIESIKAVVNGTKNSSRELPVEIVNVNENLDLALLKIPETPDLIYVPVDVCRETPVSGQTLFGFGFPEGADFTPLPGTFAGANGPSGLWQTSMPFTRGMSGGPIYDEAGHVRAIIKGGLGDAAAVRWIIPVRDSNEWLSRFNAVEQCRLISKPLISEEIWALQGPPGSGESIMTLRIDGNRRRFIYQHPRDELRPYGISEGSLNFDGTLSGTSLSGYGYVYSAKCKRSYGFKVNGRLENGRAELSGEAPAGFDNNCKPSVYRHDVSTYYRSATD